jgi:streptogramin lyase
LAQRVLVLGFVLALGACSAGGSSFTPPQSSVPVASSSAAAAVVGGSVAVSEIPVPVQPDVIAVDPSGAVYFGSAGNPAEPAGGNLYRYDGVSFTQTAPYDPPSCQTYPYESPQGCSVGGVTAIDATHSESLLWNSTYESPDESFAFGQLQKSRAGDPAVLYPSKTPVAWPISIVTAKTGKVWVGGLVAPPYERAIGSPATLPAAYPGALVLANGPNGNVWGALEYLGLGKQRTYVFEFGRDGNMLRRFPLSSGTRIGGVFAQLAGDVFASGRHGTLWFTDAGHNAIGRITASGSVTEYRLPTQKSNPNGIVAGADGAMWFTETSADKVGRIDANGNVKEFALPRGSHPTSIASDAVGTGCNPNVIWVAQRGEIARITY